MKTEIKAANITTVEWENETMTLYFIDGSIVEYYGVPEGIYAGICMAPSAGSYLNLYVCGKYKYSKTKDADIKILLEKLKHHKSITVGLWATDKPELIPENLKDVFFEITE